jgi:hypothetical protein
MSACQSPESFFVLLQRAGCLAALLIPLSCDRSIGGPIQPNDLVRGRGFGTGDQLELYRPSGPAPRSSLADPWPTDTPSLQSIEFDNLNGISHNFAGNLLALTYGTFDSGGSIYSIATDGASTIRKMTDVNSSVWPGLATTRVNGISVSPNNQRLALTGADSTRIIVFDYQAGNGDGGGDVSNPRQGALNAFGLGSPIGTAWKDDDNVYYFAAAGGGIGALRSINATTPEALATLATVNIEVSAAATDVEYNPLVSPYVYVSVGRFSGGATTNRLIVFDPHSNYSLVSNLDLSPANLEDPPRTFRELALDLDGNLYVSMYSSGTSAPVVARINDVVTNPVGLTRDDLTPNYYVSDLPGAFAQIDVALPEPSICAMALAGLACGGYSMFRRRKRA